MNDKEFKEWENQVEITKENNNKLLIGFEEWLKRKSLKPKTVKNHIFNIKFFANSFLLRYGIIPVEEGSLKIGNFLGDYFIRKASWASKNAIQENVVSFKKFYTFLNEIGDVSNKELNEMKELIKEEKLGWIEEVEDYWNNIEEEANIW